MRKREPGGGKNRRQAFVGRGKNYQGEPIRYVKKRGAKKALGGVQDRNSREKKTTTKKGRLRKKKKGVPGRRGIGEGKG